MTIHELDLVFPYLCFIYGAVMTLFLNISWLDKLAEERLPQNLLLQVQGHRGLAAGCLVVGAAWILQNLWLT